MAAITLTTDLGGPIDTDATTLAAPFMGGAYGDDGARQLAVLLLKHCAIVGLRPSIIGGQVAIETNRTRYGGQVPARFYNLAGIGATDDGAAGHNFGTLEAGVMGLIAHHGNYRWGAFSMWPSSWQPYQRYAIRNAQVLKAGYGGKCKRVGDFGKGKWATDPDYAGKLVDRANELYRGGAIVALQKPQVTSRPSPNRGYNGAAYRPETVVWHITAGSGASAVNWLTSPASGASSNYVIMENGEIVELVNPEAGANGAAWANGDVQQPDLTNALIAGWVKAGINPNLRCVSIEHAGQTSNNKGGSLTAAQIAATIRLTAWLCQRFGIAPDQDHILGHYQINNVSRHYCPGFSPAEWSSWVGQIAALVKGGTVSTPGGTIGEALKDKPQPARPPGYLMPGQADSFVWEGAEGIIVARTSRWYNPDKNKFYDLGWTAEGGYTANEVE